MRRWRRHIGYSGGMKEVEVGEGRGARGKGEICFLETLPWYLGLLLGMVGR